MESLEYAYELICPLCSKRMKLRVNHNTGQRFFGCSGYPECKQTFSVVDAEAKCSSYQAYLQSEEWDRMRKKMLKWAGYRCQLCNGHNTTLHVHHRTYENLGKEKYSDLFVLCADCHAKFHDKLP